MCRIPHLYAPDAGGMPPVNPNLTAVADEDISPVPRYRLNRLPLVHHSSPRHRRRRWPTLFADPTNRTRRWFSGAQIGCISPRFFSGPMGRMRRASSVDPTNRMSNLQSCSSCSFRRSPFTSGQIGCPLLAGRALLRHVRSASDGCRPANPRVRFPRRSKHRALIVRRLAARQYHPARALHPLQSDARVHRQ